MNKVIAKPTELQLGYMTWEVSKEVFNYLDSVYPQMVLKRNLFNGIINEFHSKYRFNKSVVHIYANCYQYTIEHIVGLKNPNVDNKQLEDIFTYLEELRDSGETNMFEACPYLLKEFHLNKEEALCYLGSWFVFKERTER